jgi:hypothetical protein
MNGLDSSGGTARQGDPYRTLARSPILQKALIVGPAKTLLGLGTLIFVFSVNRSPLQSCFAHRPALCRP